MSQISHTALIKNNKEIYMQMHIESMSPKVDINIHFFLIGIEEHERVNV